MEILCVWFLGCCPDPSGGVTIYTTIILSKNLKNRIPKLIWLKGPDYSTAHPGNKFRDTHLPSHSWVAAPTFWLRVPDSEPGTKYRLWPGLCIACGEVCK